MDAKMCVDCTVPGWMPQADPGVVLPQAGCQNVRRLHLPGINMRAGAYALARKRSSNKEKAQYV